MLFILGIGEDYIMKTKAKIKKIINKENSKKHMLLDVYIIIITKKPKRNS